MLNTPADSPPDAAPVAPPKSWRRRGVWVALLAVAVGVGLLFALSREPSPVQRGSVPKGWPNQQGTFKNSVVRRMPMWVWRARDWVRGPKRGVMIEAQFIALESWSAEDVQRLGLGAPALAEGNGVRVWLVPGNLAKSTHWALTTMPGATSISTPRMSAADDMAFTMMSGGFAGKGPNSFPTETVSWFEPRFSGERLDLKAILSSERTKAAGAVAQHQLSVLHRGKISSTAPASNTTSVATAPITHPDPLSLRVQIRDGQGVLVVQEKRAGIGGRPLAIWIQAAPMPKK